MLNNQTRQCARCKDIKAIEFFSKDRCNSGGYKNSCKKCLSESKKLYNSTDQGKKAARVREERRKEKDDYKSKKREKDKRYILNHRDKISNYFKEYAKSPMGKIIKSNIANKRRSKTKQGDVTNQQLLELQHSAKVCYWCNHPLKDKKVHIDHYVPLAKGGEHTINNLVVSCSKCNLTKNAKDPYEFANSMGKLL